MKAAPPSAFAQWILLLHSEGRLPPPIARWARARVAGDATWRAHYHLLRQAERGGGGVGAPVLSDHQRASIRAGLLDALPESSAARAPSWNMVPATVLAGACAVGFVVLSTPPVPVDDGFVARGQEGLRLQAHCAVGDVVVSHAESIGPVTSLACAEGAFVALTLTNTGSDDREVAVVTDGAGEEHGDGATPEVVLAQVVVPAGAVGVQVPAGIRLGPHQRTVRVRVNGEVVAAVEIHSAREGATP